MYCYFFVVYYHFGVKFNEYTTSEISSFFKYYLLTFTSIGVPIFFWVNGALLLNKTDIIWQMWAKKYVKFYF